MDLDCVGADLARGFDLIRVGVDEQGDLDSGASQLGNERLKRRYLARDVEPALGGDLLPVLGYEAACMRLGL